MAAFNGNGNPALSGKYRIIGVISHKDVNHYLLTRGGRELKAEIPQKILLVSTGMGEKAEDMKPERFRLVLEIVKGGQFNVPIVRHVKNPGEFEEIDRLPSDIPVSEKTHETSIRCSSYVG